MFDGRDTPVPEAAELFEKARSLDPAGQARFVADLRDARPQVADELAALLRHASESAGWLEALAERSLPQLWPVLDQDFAPGTRIGPWEIVETLGAGGMGTVYKARDTELSRWAALKFLRWPGSDAVAEERILHEARAAASLDHPNIGVLYQVGRVAAQDAPHLAGRPFLALAYYDGQTLDRWVAEGAQPPHRVVDWMLQLSRGLEVAHDAGVSHGDLKPANLLVTRQGTLKILDFGVAQGVPGATREWRGGTPGTMSPEQWRGDGAGPQSDIWSSGVVMAELLTGAPVAALPPGAPVEGRPGDGEVPTFSQAEIDRWLDTLPLPPTLRMVLQGCLQVEPQRRYETAVQMSADLEVARRTLAARGGGRAAQGRDGRPAVAVLPFVDGGLDADYEYFVDGLTSELVDHLSRLEGLRVISRSSVMRLKGREEGILEVAEELGVRYVLEGVVRRSGDRLRVTARLVDTVQGEHLWSRRFDGTVEDVFAMEESVARGVAQGLALELTSREDHALARRPIQDLRAYDAYLRARHQAWRFSAEGLTAAERSIEQALTIVGDNALLHGTMGHILAMAHETGIRTGPETLAQVEARAERVFQLEPDAFQGHWLRAFVAYQGGNMADAVRSASSALEAAPDDPDVLLLTGYVYSHVNRNQEALRLFLRAEAVDPLTPLTRCMPGFARIMDGDFEGAVTPYRTLYEMDPDSPFSQVTLGWVLDLAGERAEATRVLTRAARTFAGTPFGAWAGGLERIFSGDSDPLSGLEPLEAAARANEMFARAMAQICALGGDVDRAMPWLERAVDLGMWNEPFLARHDPYLERLRGQPRFQRLLDEVRRRLEALPEVSS